ncbi:hypothetical protein [Streptomyces sp. WAC06614]|uniref:hypothetical protein n=1 Tax=Streptomyces sp. WAC06614 TaxID=2487416 RepID=UPI000F7AC3D5|nr:hypothetical protein [Streptomyces sp. WAC06614]RSS78268.1 hypothetical protein EF918_21535 [Streptomyces sp. WAC06614]
MRGVAVLLPAAAAGLVHGWSWWCLSADSAPPGPVALVGGAVLVLGAAVAYGALRGGSGGVFGALAVAVGLLAVVAAADRAAARPDRALCVVRQIEERGSHTAGEGAPASRTVYRHVLTCPGGYPTELKEDHAVARAGGEIEVAYDARRRVSPVLVGDTSPWPAFLCAALLLAFATLVATRRP